MANRFPMCAKCRHFEALQMSESNEGMCRRYPPTLNPFKTEDALGRYYSWLFPIVQPHDRCGEYDQK
jgi:hypothetical protein